MEKIALALAMAFADPAGPEQLWDLLRRGGR